MRTSYPERGRDHRQRPAGVVKKMVTNGVALFDKELAALLERASAGQQRAAALAAARFALARNAVADPALSEALNALTAGRTTDTRLTERLQALVDSLDQVAWDLQEKEEAGQADQASRAEYLAAFQKARAANAVLAALNADPFTGACESTYEAYHATNNPAALRAVILAALSASG